MHIVNTLTVVYAKLEKVMLFQQKCVSVGHYSSVTTREISLQRCLQSLCVTCRKGMCSKYLLYIGTKYWKSKQTFPSSFGASASVHLLVTAIIASESAKQSPVCFAPGHFSSSEFAEWFLPYWSMWRASTHRHVMQTWGWRLLEVT